MEDVAAAENDLRGVRERKCMRTPQELRKLSWGTAAAATECLRAEEWAEANTWSSCLNCSLQMGHGSALSLRPRAFCSAAAHSSKVSNGGGACTKPSLPRDVMSGGASQRVEN